MSECKNCYGKGYASVMTQEVASPDFVGDEKWVGPTETKYKFCSCSRGKEIQEIARQKALEALEKAKVHKTHEERSVLGKTWNKRIDTLISEYKKEQS